LEAPSGPSAGLQLHSGGTNREKYLSERTGGVRKYPRILGLLFTFDFNTIWTCAALTQGPSKGRGVTVLADFEPFWHQAEAQVLPHYMDTEAMVNVGK